MIVISQRDAQIGGALADLGDQAAQLLVVSGRNGLAFWLLVKDLKVKPSHIVQELCIRRVQGNILCLQRPINMHLAAGKCNHRELVLLQQVAQLCGLEIPYRVGAELDSAITERRYVVYGLSFFVAPSDGCISNTDLRWRSADGFVEVGKIHWRIKHWFENCMRGN